jgi:hypothetical protein
MIPDPLADPLARTLQFAQFDSVERRRYLSPPRLTNSTSRPLGLEITLQLPSSSFQSQSIFMGGPRYLTIWHSKHFHSAVELPKCQLI